MVGSENHNQNSRTGKIFPAVVPAVHARKVESGSRLTDLQALRLSGTMKLRAIIKSTAAAAVRMNRMGLCIIASRYR